MQQATKQRLVGIAVLAALALIILPVMLDFSGEQRQRWLDIDVPPPPEPGKMEVLPLGVWSEKVDPEVNIDEDLLRQAQTGAQAEVKPESPPAKAQPAPEPPPAAKPAPQSAPKPPAPSPKEKPPAPAPEVKGWVVQIASFATEEKAMALYDRLKAKGYPVFVVSGKASATSRVFFRVRVGPQQSREEADAVQRKLKKDTGLNGLVVRSR